jgi:hypothetical protein
MGEEKEELGDSPKPPAGDALLHLFFYSTRTGIYTWGVQRGGAPLRYLILPQDWGNKGVESQMELVTHS